MKPNRRWFISLALAVLMMTGSLPEMSLPVEAETPVETGETETGEPKTGNVLSVALGTGEELNLQISGEGFPTGELHLVSNDPQAALEMYEAGSNHKADLGFLAELTDSQDQPVTLKADGKLTVTVRGTKTGEYTAPVFLLWNGETLTSVNVQKTEQGDYTFEADEIRALLILRDNGEVPAAESTEMEKTEETDNDIILGPQSADGITVTVHAPQETLPENAALAVSPYDSEKAKELTGSETVYAAADISFTSDGTPCIPSQDVTVVIEAEALKNAITPKLYHIKDDKAEEAAIASFNAETGSLEFKARDFSPYVIAEAGASMLAAPGAEPSFEYEYNVEWADKESETKKYLDADHNEVLITPANNGQQSMTLNVSLDLKGDKSVEYPAGSITMAFPASYFEGWKESDPLLVAVSDNTGSSPRVDPLYWQIPKAPETNSLSSFNYTEEKRMVDGKEVLYYVIKNHTLLTGGTVFSMAMTYYARPSMVKVVHDEARKVGVYTGDKLPIEMQIDKDLDGSADAAETKTMSVSMETKVNNSELEIMYETRSPNQGVYFTWDDRWGAKPADAGDYFYVIWYVNYHRQGRSSQGYTYHLDIDENSLSGGTIVGARKYISSASDGYDSTNPTIAGNSYEQYSVVHSRLDATYANIAKEGNITRVLEGEWVGIPKDPTSAAYRTGYTESNTYNSYHELSKNDKGGWNYQTYAVLVKYPNSVIEKAREAGVDVVNDGVALDFQASVIETWADGYVNTAGPFKPSDGRTVKVIEVNGGGPGMNKQRTSINTNGKTSIDVLEGWETFYASGEPFSVQYSMTNNAISNVFKAPETPEGFKFSGTKFQMTDGDYYLYSDFDGTKKNNNVAYGKDPGAENIAAAEPILLREGVDYDYTTFYLSESRWDASYNPVLGIQRSSAPQDNYTEFTPVEVWIRTQGSEEFTKFGEFKRETNGSYTFYFQDGGVQKTVKDSARVNFPEHTVGVQVRGDSPSYQTSTSFNFYVRYYANESTMARVQSDIDKGQRCFVGGDAKGILSRGEAVGSEQTLGQWWHRYSYALNGVSYSTTMEKVSGSVVNDSQKSEQVVPVKAGFFYSTNYHGNNVRLVEKFITKSGVLYDLLPAGTYATDIKIGNRATGPNISKQFTSGYTVEMIENWEGSGQTMLKVSYTVPDGWRMWNGDYWSGICMTYNLHNPYINIIDRGVHALNTVGLVDTSPEDVLIRSQMPAANLPKSGIARQAYYQNLFTESNAQGHETGLNQLDIVFRPVTVIEAAFTNRVQTQSETGYETERTAYLADTYDFRLRYTAQNATRTTNIVMYDVLDQGGEDEIGDFDWVDVSSIESKKTYDKDNPATGDTCKPVVYYATVVPTEFNVDDRAVWTTECPEDKSTVKAIAIDCRKTDSGKNFVLDQGGTLVGYVHCVASDNEDWAKRVNKNDAYLSAAMFVGDNPGDNPKTEIIEDNSKVHLEKVAAVIEKTSDPESGTEEEPAPIPNNEEGKSYDGLTYTLTVKNQTESGLPKARSIIVEDALPNGFTLNPKKEITLESAVWNIKAGTKISANNNVVDVLSGQDLTITITNMPVQCELKIKIPVTRAEKVIIPTDYQNTAKITKIGNLETEITSETTYHRTIPEFTLHYEVIPDEKYGEPKNGTIEHPQDVLNIPYGTEETLADVLSSPDVTADLLDGSQKDVYGKWVFTGWCEDEACSEDPVTKVTITADKTVYGKWEFKPYEVEFKKIGTVKKEPLADAVFALYGDDYYDKSGEVNKNAKPIEEGLKSDKDGLFALKKPLSLGTYYLVETEAPEFYKQPEEPLILTVDAEEGMTLETQPAGKDKENPMKLTFLVENEYLFGDLVIEKTLEKWEDSSDATFVFSVKAVKNGEVAYTDVASLTFSGPGTKSYTFTGVIPVGAEVTVTEEYSGSVYKAVGAKEVTVTVEKPSGEEDPATAKFTNTYDGTGGNKGSGILNTFTKDGESWVWTDDRPKEEQ